MQKFKLKNLFLLFIPLFFIFIGITTYAIIKTNQNQNNLDWSSNDDKQDDDYDNIDIFPQLNIYDFYQYLKIINGKPTITDDFIAAVIKKVITDIKLINGTLNYEILISTTTSLKIAFQFQTLANTYEKTYDFNVNF